MPPPSVLLRSGRSSWRLKNVEQRAYVLFSLGGMPQFQVRVDHVVVAAPDAFTGHVARLDEVSDDPLRRPFRDSHDEGDVAQARVGVAGDREKYTRVVGDERPMRLPVVA